MKNYLIFGAPCTGKGTICNLLAERQNFKHLSTGDMIRKEMERETKIGEYAKLIGVDKGTFLPDKIISEMVKNHFIMEYPHVDAGFLLDGYPRTIAQAKDIASYMFNRREPFEALVHFKTDNVTLVERMNIRAKELGREDDTEDTFKRRLKKYEDETKPILDYFAGKGKVIEIDASGTIEQQYARVRKAMGFEPNFSAIVATGMNNEIGSDNKLLWHLPDDFKYFQDNTIGKALVMGRKTYESLGRLDLPKRHIFVVTRDLNYQVAIDALDKSGMYKGSKDNVTVVHTIEEAVAKSIDWTENNDQNEIMVCGGSQIYSEFLDKGLISKVYKTQVEGEFEADSFFPDLNKFKLKAGDPIKHEKDEKHDYAFSFIEWC